MPNKFTLPLSVLLFAVASATHAQQAGVQSGQYAYKLWNQYDTVFNLTVSGGRVTGTVTSSSSGGAGQSPMIRQGNFDTVLKPDGSFDIKFQNGNRYDGLHPCQGNAICGNFYSEYSVSNTLVTLVRQ